MTRLITDTRRLRHPAYSRLVLREWHCAAGHAPAQWAGDRGCPRCGVPGLPGRLPGRPPLLPVNRAA